ncbi:DUF58 domain-containing protein [Halosimplex sp. J119]
MDVDDMIRLGLAAIGAVVFVLGAAAYVVVDPFADMLPSTFAVVAFAGLVAFLLGLWAIRTAYQGGVDQTAIPDVELPRSFPAPGSDLDLTLYRLTHLRQGTSEYRDQIQERLAEAAVSAIRQRENCTRAQAVHQLEEGEWTDNYQAASFFAGGSPPSQSRLDRWLGDDDRTPYEQWVDTTVEAIADYAGIETASEPEAAATESSGGLLAGLRGGDGDEGPRAQAGYRDQYIDENAERITDSIVYNELIKTGQWRGVTAFALVAVGWGVITATPAIVLVAVLGVAFSAYARAATPPQLGVLDVERTFDESDVKPGDVVEVTVTVENTGGSLIPDLRLIDRVPGNMRVVNGTPRLATALGSGDTVTFTYEVVAERGTHEWPLLAIGRDFSGAVEREAVVDVEGEIQCVPSLRTTAEMPVRQQTSLYSGQENTSTGGSGLEFFAVREYRESDPMNRIDWKRQARTGELATIDFRLERAASLVFLFDARDASYVAPEPGEHHAVDRSVEAAVEAFGALSDQGNMVGLAAFDTVPCWLAPSAGDAHLERARQMFATHPAMSSTPPEESETEGHYVDPMTHVRSQLSPESQLVLFSPLTDDYTVEVARRLDSSGHRVTVISPNPTADRTVGQRLARIERTMRIATLRERDIRVVDWDYDSMLGLALDEARQRWAV